MNDHLLEIKEKMRMLMWIFLFAILILVGRIFIVQFMQGKDITAKAYDLWTRSIPVEGQRGNIYDRNGKLIVGNQLAPSIALIPRQIEKPEEVAEFLSKLLEISYEDAYEHTTKKISIELIKPEGRKLSAEKAAKVIAKNFKGVYLTGDTKRYYPHETLLAQTLGFTGIDNQGIAGIEYIYDDYLMGNTGYSKYFTDAKGNSLGNTYGIYSPPTKGFDIHLTIDLDLQILLERVLFNTAVRYTPEEALGIIMNPKTGEVLAMASSPTYNPAKYQEYEQEIYNRNLPIWKSYEPGSTFKIVTYAAGIEEGVFLFDEHFYDPGYIMVGNRRINDWKPGGHGDQTFLQVIQNSCNPGFVTIGQRLGSEKLFDYINDFGFGKKSNIDLLGESTGIVFKKDNVGPLELATSAFGQGNSATPIQLVNATSAAVNGGNLMQPYILSKIMDDKNETVLENMPKIKNSPISKSTSDKVKYALESVVAYGTGRNAYIDGYRIGGKTGTAQKVKDGVYMENNYIVSFIGAAPMNDPELVVYIAVDNPKNTIQFGGVVAAPLVKEIMQEALPIVGVQKQKEQLELEYRWNDNKYIETPNLLNTEIKKLIPTHQYQLEHIGNGNKVVAQLPRPGVRMREGGTIIIYLE